MPLVGRGSAAIMASVDATKKDNVGGELCSNFFWAAHVGSRQRNTFEHDSLHGYVQGTHAAAMKTLGYENGTQ